MRGKSSAVSEGGSSPNLVSGHISAGRFSPTDVAYMTADGNYKSEHYSQDTDIAVPANTLLWAFFSYASLIEVQGGAQRIAYSSSTDGVFWITGNFELSGG